MNNVLNHIAKDIQNKMTRFGIVAEFHVEEFTNRKGKTFYTVKSSDFSMQPMIFKNIHAEGDAKIEQDKSYTYIEVTINLLYQHWNYGSNGFPYVRFNYCINNDNYENDIPKFKTERFNFCGNRQTC